MKLANLGKLFNIVVPLAVWSLLLLVPFFNQMDNLAGPIRNAVRYHQILFITALMCSYYLHSYLIYPLRNKTYGLYYYTGALAVLAIIYLFTSHMILPDFPQPPDAGFKYPPGFKNMPPGTVPSPGMGMLFIPFVFVVTVSFCHRLYVDTIARDKLIKEREYVHIKTELDFLRSQVSPHFIFNLMNTLVSMARKNSKELEPSLISLSQLMRYMLYETDENKLSLKTEIAYLQNYINLQLLRFQDDVRVNIHLDGPFEKYTIEPMLLIPFVENAFKHSISVVDKATIDIAVVVNENERLLSLTVLNSIARVNGAPAESAGIGLNNVKRRLELIYPGKHKLTINEGEDSFLAMLQINL